MGRGLTAAHHGSSGGVAGAGRVRGDSVARLRFCWEWRKGHGRRLATKLQAPGPAEDCFTRAVCPPGTSVSSRGRAPGTRTEWGVRPPWCGFGGVVYGDRRFPRAGLLPRLSPAAVPAPLGCPSTFTSMHSFVYSTTIPGAPPAARGSGRGLGVPWQVGGTPDLPPPPAGHHGH